ncbi:MAG: hypothetical protein JXR83_07390 [Deltaproteobacteria bacterium]|nr:hypothetical protein [Deltaproteobacteria bacterium]
MAVSAVGGGGAGPATNTGASEPKAPSLFDRVKSAVDKIAQGVRDAAQKMMEQRNRDQFTTEPPRPAERQTIRDFQPSPYKQQVHVITTPRKGLQC